MRVKRTLKESLVFIAAYVLLLTLWRGGISDGSVSLSVLLFMVGLHVLFVIAIKRSHQAYESAVVAADELVRKYVTPAIEEAKRLEAKKHFN